jgi:ArsR family transcriptional regulator
MTRMLLRLDRCITVCIISLTNRLNSYIATCKYKETFSMKELIKVMKALSEPNRLKILKMLQHKTLCVCEIKEALHIAQPTVSKHLRILEEAELVRFEKDGLWVNYMLDDRTRNPYALSTLNDLKVWLENDEEIQEIIAKLAGIQREIICKK